MQLSTRAGRTPAALAALAVMTALAISACGSSSSSSSSTSSSSKPSSTATASKSPFTLLMVIDTSGPTKVYGTVDLASMQAAVKYWNGHGGILGHPITIKTLNDNGDATTAVSVATSYLTSNPKPDMIFAGTSGIDSAGLIPLVKRDGLLDVAVDDGDNVCQTNAQMTCPTAFVPAVDTPTQMQSVVSFMKSKGWKKIGVLEEEDAFSESETGPLQSELTKNGMSASVVTFSPTAVNVNPQISELQSDGVNVIFVEGLAAAPGYAISGRAALGLINKMPYVFDAGAAAVDLTKLTPSVANLANSWEEISRASDPYVSMPGRTLLLKYGTPAVSAATADRRVLPVDGSRAGAQCGGTGGIDQCQRDIQCAGEPAAAVSGRSALHVGARHPVHERCASGCGAGSRELLRGRAQRPDQERDGVLEVAARRHGGPSGGHTGACRSASLGTWL